MMPVVLTAQNSDDQTLSPDVMQAVLANFPKEILADGKPATARQDDPDDHSRTCVTAFSRKADGSPDLVAVIYNGDHTEVAMLAYEKGKARVLDAVTDRKYFLGGEFCEINIVNLADPANPSSPLAKAVVASFSANYSCTADYYFVWSGARLEMISPIIHEFGPERAAESDTDCSYAVDLDHRGAMQIVGSDGNDDRFPQDDGIASTGTSTLFRYNGATYEPAKNLIYVEEYEPNLPKTADEKTEYKSDVGQWMGYIAMHHAPAPSYPLTIINGDRDGSNRVTSAEIKIDGVTVILPREVNQQVETLTRTVQLHKENMLKVTVDGPPNSHMYVTIDDVPTALPAPMPLMGNQAIYITNSDLTYDPVSKTSSETLTITNEGDRTIIGPISVMLDSLRDVSMTNATGIHRFPDREAPQFTSAPYITIPNTNSLAPGKSASVQVKFSNPKNLSDISFDPKAYVGPMQ
jgi:hypothetical protein